MPGHADRPAPHRPARDPCSDGGRYRQALPPAVPATRGRPRGVRNDDLRTAALGHTQVPPAHGPRGRTRSGQCAAGRHGPAGARARRVPQRGARCRDHRPQHGVPGEEGVQRGRRLGAAA